MASIKLLIVDDEPVMRDIIRYGLQECLPGITVDEARNGKQAKEYIGSNGYDLVVCDWEIPHINGEELLTWLKGHATLNETPFIVLSTTQEKSLIMRALELGATSYIIKPFTIAVLMQKVTAILDKSKIREFERYTADNPVWLIFKEGKISGQLIDISAGGLLGTFKRETSFPRILDQVTVKIEVDNGQGTLELEGLTVRMQAVTAKEDAKAVNIAVKFSEISPVNNTALIRHFAKDIS